MNMSEEQCRAVFESIAVPLPNSDTLYATNFKTFQEAIKLVEKNSYLKGKKEGLLLAKEIVEENLSTKKDAI